jgi:hypothetical protein
MRVIPGPVQYISTACDADVYPFNVQVNSIPESTVLTWVPRGYVDKDTWDAPRNAPVQETINMQEKRDERDTSRI